jgi:glycosyltransferase involved in cell wall biosynthesis
MIGAVNLELIKKYKEKNRSTILEYDAVFQGRFHPQKGVEELVRIWKIVVNEIPDAKLLMIGDGPLMSSVRLLINDLNLNKNIILCGYVYDGDKKYKIFSRSKMVVHPAFYDSGGMAAAEAMAFGIPCIGFNLKSYNSYYPKGMIKTRTNTLNGFANEIIKVLRNEKLRKQIGKDAEGLIYKSYSWSFRSEEIIAKIHSKR